MGFDYDFLKLEMEVKDDKVSIKAGGLLGPLVQPLVQRFGYIINEVKVIHRYTDGSLRHNLYMPPIPSKAGVRGMARKLIEQIQRTRLPATANLAVTNDCQAHCVHCSADPFKDPSRRELTADEIKLVVDQSLALGANIVIYTGGDPLCRSDLAELIAYVDPDKANRMIFTNGLGLTDKRVKELADAGLATLNISIDHSDPKIHNELRGVPNLYEKAFEGAKRAMEAGILAGISTYATGEKVKDGTLEKLFEIAAENGFKEITVFDCIPSGKFIKQYDVVLKPDEREQVVSLCKKYRDDKSFPLGVQCQAIINSPQGVGCYGANSQFYMTSYGDINPCDFNPISFGNVREMPLQQIWQKMRNHPHFGKDHPTCRMQTPEYRRMFIDILPDDFKLPVPIEEIHKLWAENNMQMPAAQAVFS